MNVKIADRTIGEGKPCFVIAEAGVNHNGDMKLARQLIDAAKEAGADAVKFQTFTAAAIVTPRAPKAAYQKKTTAGDKSHYDILKKLELTEKDHRDLKKYAESRGIMFLSTPYDEAGIDLLVKLGVPALKISSTDITNHPLLAQAAATRLTIVLSTGMSTLDEIKDAIGVITGAKNKKLVLLHCVSSYPAKIADVNLRAMNTLKQAFGFPVGYSDHTMGIEVPLAAVAMGAVVIEKHLTASRKLPGPDHRASLEPEEFRRMVAAIRDVEKALGNGIKKPTQEEEENKKACRRSIVAAVDIPKGAIITREMLGIKRPGTGVEPRYVDMIVGKKARRPIKSEEPVTFAMVS